MSQMATTSPPKISAQSATFSMSLAPLPPTPMPAKYSLPWRLRSSRGERRGRVEVAKRRSRAARPAGVSCDES